jgi:hypothetical protein
MWLIIVSNLEEIEGFSGGPRDFEWSWSWVQRDINPDGGGKNFTQFLPLLILLFWKHM